MHSRALPSCLSDEDGVSFSLPDKCPVKTAPIYSLNDYEQVSSEVVSLEASLVEGKGTLRKTKGKKGAILVESQVRRSSRVKKNKNGFKEAECKDKNCPGCNSKPPTLSTRSIRKLSSSLCDVDAALVSDEALKKVKKAGAVSKSKKPKVKGKKTKETPPLDVDSSKTEDENPVDDIDS
jgi:hypothetical protein